MRCTHIFFWLENGICRAIPQHTYASVVRRDTTVPELAGTRVRVADWYVEHRNGEVQLENETYTTLYFDQTGWAGYVPDPLVGPAAKASSLGSTQSSVPTRAAALTRGANDEPPDTGGVWAPEPNQRRHMWHCILAGSSAAAD